MCVDLCSSVANQIPLNLDHAFKNELGWAGQGHVLKLHSGFLKPHLKLISTAHKYIDGPAHVFGSGKNERARYHTGAARKRLVFNTSLVGAHCNFFWSAFLDEVYIGALGRKHVVVANGRTFPAYIDITDSRNRDDHMRHATVDNMNGL